MVNRLVESRGIAKDSVGSIDLKIVLTKTWRIRGQNERRIERNVLQTVLLAGFFDASAVHREFKQRIRPLINNLLEAIGSRTPDDTSDLHRDGTGTGRIGHRKFRNLGKNAKFNAFIKTRWKT